MANKSIDSMNETGKVSSFNIYFPIVAGIIVIALFSFDFDSLMLNRRTALTVDVLVTLTMGGLSFFSMLCVGTLLGQKDDDDQAPLERD